MAPGADSHVRRPRRTTLAFISLGVVFTLLLIGIGEASFLTLRYLVKGPMELRSPAAPHPRLGWTLNPKQGDVERQNRCGESVLDRTPPGAFLSKLPKYDRSTRVLFLGDSFTHGHEVSTGARYYDHFEEIHRDHYSVYAAGVGGYGSLQQYLLLQEISEEVRPDMVVWQLHPNDLANNVYEFERGFLFNNRRDRPYLDLETDEIYIANPGYWMFELESSRFLLERFLGVDQLFGLGVFEAVSDWIRPSDEDWPRLEAEGLEVLRRVLGRARVEFPAVHFVGFNVGDAAESEFAGVFVAAGADYVAGVARGVSDDPEPTDCLPLDEHWNHHGNAVAGRFLARSLSPDAIAAMHTARVEGHMARQDGSAARDGEAVVGP